MGWGSTASHVHFLPPKDFLPLRILVICTPCCSVHVASMMHIFDPPPPTLILNLPTLKRDKVFGRLLLAKIRGTSTHSLRKDTCFNGKIMSFAHQICIFPTINSANVSSNSANQFYLIQRVNG